MSDLLVSPRRRQAPGSEISFPHQASYPFARAVACFIAQFSVNTWTAIAALMPLERLLNCFGKVSIFSFALAGGALQPCVIATLGHCEHAAHGDNGRFLLVVFDELISHLDSREKMLMAFFRISRSCRKISFSRFKRRFSSSQVL